MTISYSIVFEIQRVTHCNIQFEDRYKSLANSVQWNRRERTRRVQIVLYNEIMSSCGMKDTCYWLRNLFRVYFDGGYAAHQGYKIWPLTLFLNYQDLCLIGRLSF